MRLIKKILFVLFFVFFFTSCNSKAPFTQRSQLILISQSQELSLGEKSYKDALSKSKIIRGTKDSKRVKDIGYRLAKVANRSDYKWEFTLVENEAKNAFCLPGGKVVVYTGILQVAKNNAQLATVMSHEIAHALARHGAERLSTGLISNGIRTIGNILISTKAPQYAQTFNIAYGLGAQYGVMLPYGRLQESEADSIGIHLMDKAGYNMDQAIKFWENMSQGRKQINQFFSTHPSSLARIKNIKNVIASIRSSKQIR